MIWIGTKEVEVLIKRIVRRLRQGKIQLAAEDLEYVLVKLRNMKYYEEADLLEMTFNQYLLNLISKPEFEAESAA